MKDSPFWNELTRSLKPYVPGEQPTSLGKLIKLNTNELPYGPSPKALQAIKNATTDDLRLYPDPHAHDLKQSIAKHYGVGSDQVFVGNGSDEVLAHIFKGLFQPSQPILRPDYSYGFYPVYCQFFELQACIKPLADDFSLDLKSYTEPNGGIVFANPNAPTGMVEPLSEIRDLLIRHADSVVVVDEAYVDFAEDSAVSMVKDYDNLLVVQTFSKSRAFAGMRIGYAIGQAPLIAGLERIKNAFNPYPLDRLALIAAQASMEDKAHLEDCTQRLINTRSKVSEFLVALGFQVLPSKANFIFVRPPEGDALKLFEYLRGNKIIVRHFDLPRISEWLRISIGSEDEMQVFASVVKAYVNG